MGGNGVYIYIMCMCKSYIADNRITHFKWNMMMHDKLCDK